MQVDGVARTSCRLDGDVIAKRRIGGDLSMAKTQRELRFLPRDRFPEVGCQTVLYIDTIERIMYSWDGDHYVQMSGSGEGAQIDDEGVYTTKTWSSSKINSELEEDQTQLDNLAYSLVSNAEIDAILNS